MIWAAVVTVFTVVAAAVVLSLYGKDPTILLLVLTAVVTPVVTSVFLRKDVQEVKQQLGTVEDKVSGVDQKVNGHLTALTAKIPDGATVTEVSDGIPAGSS